MANKKQAPKGKFNFYWIYGIIAAVLIGSMLLSSGNTDTKTTVDDFRIFANKGYVEKLIVIKNTGLAELFIKKDNIEDFKSFDQNNKLLKT
jgi:cell division protease FtsH